MQTGIRDFIRQLDEHDALLTVEKEVDPRHVSALITSTDKAVWLKNVREYDFPIVGGIVRDADKVALALGCKPNEVAWKLQEATI